MYSLANPQRFMSLSGRVLPFVAILAVITLAVGLYMAFSAPPDFRQGETVRIMYIHVPSAWLAMMAYMMIAIAGLGVLIWRHPLADVAAKAAAPLGAAFTFLALVTGSLWGKPMWGTYWQWDARMTSMLVLLFLYLGLMALRSAMEDASRASRVTAILALVGAINIPIIKFSVDWWETLHQPASVFRMSGSTIHPDLLWPLMVMAVGFTLLFFALHLAAMRNEIMRRRAIGLQLRRVDNAAAALAT
ncbi:MAG: heme ABC transporter permease CcmC [Hyphomicrobiaceae bacterium]